MLEAICDYEYFNHSYEVSYLVLEKIGDKVNVKKCGRELHLRTLVDVQEYINKLSKEIQEKYNIELKIV